MKIFFFLTIVVLALVMASQFDQTRVSNYTMLNTSTGGANSAYVIAQDLLNR